jgi:tRNAThr (cytosine32-N3)-methyltransferase
MYADDMNANQHYAKARVVIDAVHAGDPKRTVDGRPAELVYADRMEAWVLKLRPESPELLRLAARCQHLERWATPRDSYPMDKVGYHAWRRGLYVKQAERARGILLDAGVDAAEADAVATWVSKTGLKTNDGSQALEDAACLVFLENEIADFAVSHADYTEEKFVDILRKTWKKMSAAAQAAALALELPAPIAALVRTALSA